MIKSKWQAIVSSAAIFLVLSATVSPAQTDIAVADAQRLAYTLVERGQYSAALELLDTLQQDGFNETAISYIARSRAERALGDAKEAIRSGRRAYNLAETQAEKFLAARATAQAHSTADNRSLAQIWLRLASQHAPNDRAYAINRRDFNHVRARNPLSLNFNLSVRPTDNINNAPTDNTFFFGGLTFVDPTLVPISGTRIETTSVVTYRLPTTVNRTSELQFVHAGRRVLLESEASEIDPDLSASDLSSDHFAISWAHKFRRTDQRWVIDARLRGFVDFSSGDHIQNGGSLEVGYRFPVTENQSVRFAGEYINATRIDNDLRSFESWSAQTTWNINTEEYGRVSLDIEYTDTQSESFAVARDEWELTAEYKLPSPVLGTSVSLTAEYQEARFDEPLFGPEPRFDRTLSGTLTTVIPAAEMFGFVPVINLSRERVQSNVSTFDTESTDLSVSIRSSF